MSEYIRLQAKLLELHSYIERLGRLTGSTKTAPADTTTTLAASAPGANVVAQTNSDRPFKDAVVRDIEAVERWLLHRKIEFLSYSDIPEQTCKQQIISSLATVLHHTNTKEVSAADVVHSRFRI